MLSLKTASDSAVTSHITSASHIMCDYYKLPARISLSFDVSSWVVTVIEATEPSLLSLPMEMYYILYAMHDTN